MSNIPIEFFFFACIPPLLLGSRYNFSTLPLHSELPITYLPLCFQIATPGLTREDTLVRLKVSYSYQAVINKSIPHGGSRSYNSATMYRNHEGKISQMEESVGDVSPIRPFKNAPADLFNFTQHHREVLRTLLNGYTYVSGPVRRDDATRTLEMLYIPHNSLP